MAMDPEEQLRILEEASGDPAHLALATVDLTFPNHEEPERALLKTALEAAAIPHWFDDAVLRSLLDSASSDESEEARLRLASLSVVESFPARGETAMNVHEATRLAIRSRMAAEQPGRFAELSGRAARHFEADDTPQGRIEVVFHLLCADPDVGAQRLEELLRLWERTADRQDMAALAEAASELEEQELVSGRARVWVLLAVASAASELDSAPDLAEITHAAVDAAQRAGDVGAEGWALNLEGERLTTRGGVAEAFAAFERSLVIRRRIDAEASDADSRSDVASTVCSLGDLERDQGKLDDALHRYEENLAVTLQVAEAQEHDPSRLLSYAVAQNRLGILHSAKGDHFAALVAQQGYLDTIRRVADDDPTRDRWQRELGMATRCVGACLMELGDLDEAKSTAEEALMIHERLAKSDESSVLWQTDLAETYRQLGDTLMLMQQLFEAQAAFELDLALMQRLAARDQSNADVQLGLAAAHNRIGDVLQSQGALWEARAAFRQGLMVNTRMAARDPSNVLWSRELAVARHRLGLVLRESGEGRAARRENAAAYLAMVAIVDEQDDNVGWREDLEAIAPFAPWWAKVRVAVMRPFR